MGTMKKSFENRIGISSISESLIASMQDGFSVLDKNGVPLDVNPALCCMTGFSREDLVGVNAPFPYWPPEAFLLSKMI